jgi:oxygen-independent coproporphyrinogen III oxidase
MHIRLIESPLSYNASMQTMNELIKKYNRPGPRYTSYPPVPFWQNSPDQESWINHLKTTYNSETGLDLYVHVPFCESLCFYCGCNRTITKNHSVEDKYLELILKEWDLYQQKLGFTPQINSLHFGGGTPTFLSPKNLDQLIKALLKNHHEEFIGSIEIDPRTCRPEHLKVLADNGIKRVSLGIQDFDSVVQHAINRYQPISLVEDLLIKIRQHHFSSINFDLIYGLPKQTVQTVTDTIKVVAKMKPDLIAFYSYAHLPEKIKNQRLIKESDLPSPELKRELYETGKKLLIEAGYEDIGMDHFALPTSFLFQAQKNKNLHRNFMGYVDKKSSILLGLGPTSISDSSLSFMQNTKELKDYETRINANELPLEKGHTHTSADLKVQKIIQDLMCQHRVDISLSELPDHSDISQELKRFSQDGLLELNGPEVVVTPLGKTFVRNIAMTFDYHLRRQQNPTKFSQTI